MNIFIDDHRIILEKLIEKKVGFILIGGYAVNYHGYNRTTADLDVWIKPDNANKLLLIEVLRALDFEQQGLKIIEGWDFEKPQLFNIFPKPFHTEFMTHISGIQYADAELTVINATVDGLTIPVIHINSLIINKRASGRTKDLADAEYLEKILSLRNKSI